MKTNIQYIAANIIREYANYTRVRTLTQRKTQLHEKKSLISSKGRAPFYKAQTKKKQLESATVEYEDISERNRLGIGINNNLNVKFTAKGDSPVCTQGIFLTLNQTQIRLRSRTFTNAELRNNHYPPVFKPASPIIAQHNPNSNWSQFRPTNDKRVNTRRLHQRQSSHQYIDRCSPTLVDDIDFNKTWFQNLATYSLWCHIPPGTGD